MPSESDDGQADRASDREVDWAWIAFVDILVFFGVLMVGFAYLWRRGDIDWVRSTAAEKPMPHRRRICRRRGTQLRRSSAVRLTT